MPFYLFFLLHNIFISYVLQNMFIKRPATTRYLSRYKNEWSHYLSSVLSPNISLVVQRYETTLKTYRFTCSQSRIANVHVVKCVSKQVGFTDHHWAYYLNSLKRIVNKPVADKGIVMIGFKSTTWHALNIIRSYRVCWLFVVQRGRMSLGVLYPQLCLMLFLNSLDSRPSEITINVLVTVVFASLEETMPCVLIFPHSMHLSRPMINNVRLQFLGTYEIAMQFFLERECDYYWPGFWI